MVVLQFKISFTQTHWMSNYSPTTFGLGEFSNLNTSSKISLALAVFRVLPISISPPSNSISLQLKQVDPHQSGIEEKCWFTIISQPFELNIILLNSLRYLVTQTWFLGSGWAVMTNIWPPAHYVSTLYDTPGSAESNPIHSDTGKTEVIHLVYCKTGKWLWA